MNEMNLQGLAMRRVYVEVNKNVYDLMQAAENKNAEKIQSLSQKILNAVSEIAKVEDETLGHKLIKIDIGKLKTYFSENQVIDAQNVKKMVQAIVDDLSHINLARNSAKFSEAYTDPNVLALSTAVLILQRNLATAPAEEQKQIKSSIEELERLIVERVKHNAAQETKAETPELQELEFQRAQLQKELKFAKTPSESLMIRMAIDQTEFLINQQKSIIILNNMVNQYMQAMRNFIL